MIHIVEDDDAVRDSLVAVFNSRGIGIRDYASAEDFFAALPIGDRDCVVTDYMMPRTTGFDLLRQLREAGNQQPVIVITGRTSRNMAAEALSLGAAAFIEKPFQPETIIEAVVKATSQAMG